MMDKTSSTSTVPRVRNCSREDVAAYIQKQLGPKHLPMTIVIPLTFIYVAIFIAGVVGNLAVCRVIAKNPAMQTPTNYYLFSLAVSDLSLLILGLPYDVSLYWQQYPWSLGLAMCKCRALVSEMSSYTSVLTIVAFSMERYLAICHPLLSYSMSGLRRTVKIIAVLWIVSLIAASPFAVFTKINYLEYPENSGNYLDESAFCAMLAHNLPNGIPIYELSFLLFFLLPMVFLIVLYLFIGRKIQSRGRELSSNIDGSVHRDANHLRSRRKIIRMLTAVVITFFTCWVAFHGQRLFYLHGTKSEFYLVINEWAFYITGALYYLSATMNPILYTLMSDKYRRAFRQILSCGYSSHQRSGNKRDYIDTILLRNSSMRASSRRSRRGGSAESSSSHCDTTIEKKSYTAVPTAVVGIRQHRQRFESISSSHSNSYGDGNQHQTSCVLLEGRNGSMNEKQDTII